MKMLYGVDWFLSSSFLMLKNIHECSRCDVNRFIAPILKSSASPAFNISNYGHIAIFRSH